MADTDAGTDAPDFDTVMPASGRLETLSPLVRRRVAPNGGPFTASGTCTYVVGHGRVAVIDPGTIEVAVGDDRYHLPATVKGQKLPQQ